MGAPKLDLESDIWPVSDFRANASEAIQHVKSSGRAVVLTQRGRSAAVLLGVAAYQALLDELELLKDVQRGLADVAAGRVIPHEQVRDELLRDFPE